MNLLAGLVVMSGEEDGENELGSSEEAKAFAWSVRIRF
jgi:hypothetical protein